MFGRIRSNDPSPHNLAPRVACEWVRAESELAGAERVAADGAGRAEWRNAERLFAPASRPAGKELCDGVEHEINL